MVDPTISNIVIIDVLVWLILSVLGNNNRKKKMNVSHRLSNKQPLN